MNDLTSDNGTSVGTYWFTGVVTAVFLFITFGFGWIVAHNVVASECNKLGAFYVGGTVYECRVKK